MVQFPEISFEKLKNQETEAVCCNEFSEKMAKTFVFVGFDRFENNSVEANIDI